MSFSWQTVARSLGCPHLKASKESPGIGGSAPPLRAADQEQESFGTGSVYSSEEISCCSLRLKRGIEFKPRIPVISKLRSADNGAIHVIDCLVRSEEHTSELQSPCNLVCRLLLEKKKKKKTYNKISHECLLQYTICVIRH